MKKAALHNLGCKVNAFETQAMEKLLREHGYEIVPFSEMADIYVINTCTVTNIADRKSRQMLHKARKRNPEAVIVAAGCYVQAASGKAQADDSVDIVLGNNCKKDIVSVLEAYEADRKNRTACLDIGHTEEFEIMELGVETGHTRANLKVQDGCNQFCSYCIIPYVRGRIRSLPLQEAVRQVQELVEHGFQEIVLTGIHISSYGKDLKEREIQEEGTKETDLLSLIRTVHQVQGLKRLRLGSLEPGIITEEFVREISKMEKLCPHFHLSLQSGSRTVLERMNRKYTPEEYYGKCLLLRKFFKNPAITTDVIVGFPGETEEEFKECRDFLNQVDFYEAHVFKYSMRQGTKAAAMGGQIEEGIKARRSACLISDGKLRARRYRESFISKEAEALLEEEQEMGGEKYWTGFTKEYVKIAVKAENQRKNTFVNVRIHGFLEEDLLIGEII